MRGFGVGSVGAIEADHGVEVDGSALLELGDLAVRQPGDLFERFLCDADLGGDLAAQPVDEAVP